MISFDQMTAADAKALINKPDYFDTNKDFFDGDHWQSGEGFADKIAPPSSPTYQTVKTGLERIFVAENHIREIVKRRTDGVLARSPQWEYVRKVNEEKSIPREELLLPEITKPVRKWWKERECHNLLKDLMDEGSLHKNAMLRLYVPPGRLLKRGRDLIADVSTPEEALDLIYVDVVKNDVGVLHTDTYSMRDIGVIEFVGPSFTEVVSRETASDAEWGNYLEVTYIDTNTKQTVHKMMFDDGRDDRIDRYDLGGRLMMYAIDDMLLVTETIRQLNKTINTTDTHMALNNRETNFQQRIFLNAQPPGTVIIDPETGERTLKVEAVERGADKDMFLVGVEEEQMDSTIKYKDPRVETLNPTDPRSYIESAGALRRALYREAKQLHIELIKDATSTGEARMQAAADFEQDLNDVKGILDAAGKWLLETVWMFAQNLAGETPDNDIKVDFSAHITLGPIPVERMRAQVELKQANLLSSFTAMNQNGIENPEVEMQRIQDEDEYQLELLKKKIEVLSSLQRAGIETKPAAELAGFTEDEAKLLVEVEVVEEEESFGTPTGQSARASVNGSGA